MTHVTMILNPSCCGLTGTPDLHWSLACLVNTLNNTWWKTYPKQLGLTKFPAHALDITWIYRWEKYYRVYALIYLKSTRFFLSLHLHMLSIFCSLLNLYIYPDLLVILTCMFQRLKVDTSKMEPSSPSRPGHPQPSLPQELAFRPPWCYSTSLRLSWILSYPWSCHQKSSTSPVLSASGLI